VDVSYHTAGELRAYTDMPADIAATPQKDFGLTLSADKQKELIHGYYAAISYTDALVGKLLDALDSLELSKNTIVVLWGDHGWHLGDHNLWCKHSNFEEATHAPLFISGPGIKSNKTKSFSEHVDVFPTICDLAGVPIPAQLQGKSLKPVMINPESTVKEYAVSQYPRSSAAEENNRLGYADANVMGYSIRDKQYRYTIWMRNSFRSTMPFNPASVIGDELYDYKADPLEKHNAAKDKKYEAVTAKYKKEMLRYFESQVKK
jgi:arylsulfatase A-like enzyme